MLKLNQICIIAGVIVFSACSKKESVPAVPAITVQESKSLVASTNTDVQTSHDEFVNSDAIQANTVLEGFSFVGNYAPSDPTNIANSNSRKARDKSLVASRMYDAVKKHIPAAFNRILLDVLDSDFSNAVGVYEYNPNTDSFDQTTVGGTSVVVKFPYPKTNSINNAVYTVSKFVESNYNGNVQPNAIEANLQIGGVPVMTISLVASYDSNGDPTAIALDYVLGNKSIDVKLTSNSTQVNVALYYSKNGSHVFGETATINYTNINKTDVSQISFTYLLSKVTLKGSYDLSGLFADPNITSADTPDKINALYDKYVKMELDRSSDGLKFADVKLRSNNNNTNYVIFYSDGSQGDFSPILSALVSAGISTTSINN